MLQPLFEEDTLLRMNVPEDDVPFFADNLQLRDNQTVLNQDFDHGKALGYIRRGHATNLQLKFHAELDLTIKCCYPIGSVFCE